MSTRKKILVTKQPRTAFLAKDYRENDDFSDDYQDDEPETRRTIHSSSKVELIRTRDLDTEAPSVENASSWYTSSTGLIIAVVGVLGLAMLFVIPTVVGILLVRNPLVSSNTTLTTTAAPPASYVYWAFDNDPSDLYGVYNGTISNGATFSNNTYFGYGFTLVLNNTLNQSIMIASPFLNLSYTSFTLEAWIYGITLTGDNAVFSQCLCSSCQDQCLYMIIRNYKLYMGFTLDDVIGSTVLTINTWYHVAFVYDYSTRTQSLYVQGVLDTSRSSAGPYQGQSGTTIIGSSVLTTSSFNGYIDNMKLATRAKSASEILADGSVVVYFSFDGSSLTQDEGPNLMNGSLSNANVVTGRVGQGLAFSGLSSYLQIYGFYQLGQSHKAFSFAVWVYPYSVTGGTLILKTTLQYSGGTWCQAMMGFTQSGQIAFHVNGVNPQVTGPFIPILQWTHIVFTYSQTDGQTLYINGTESISTIPTNFYSSGVIDWLTIGYDFGGCDPSPMAGRYYFGVIDEFYVYRRELTASDAYSLANP